MYTGDASPQDMDQWRSFVSTEMNLRFP